MNKNGTHVDVMSLKNVGDVSGGRKKVCKMVYKVLNTVIDRCLTSDFYLAVHIQIDAEVESMKIPGMPKMPMMLMMPVMPTKCGRCICTVGIGVMFHRL